MTLSTYSSIGTALCWLGFVAIATSIFLFLASSRGVSIGNPDGLHLHDTYFILFSWGHRTILLFPLVAGILLIFTGLQARKQAATMSAELQRIQEAEEAGSSNGG
jgi:hypothetical protein